MTYVSEKDQEVYNGKIVNYLTFLGYDMPQVRVDRLAAVNPLGYYQRAVDACKYEIGLVRTGSPSLDIIIEQKNLAESKVEELSKERENVAKRLAEMISKC